MLVDPATATRIADAASHDGVPVFVLDTDGQYGKTALFDAIRSTCPLDPPLGHFRDVWDALADSLFGGIDRLGADAAVIVWTGASAFRENAETDYTIALEIFNDLTQQLADPDISAEKPTKLTVYLDTAPAR